MNNNADNQSGRFLQRLKSVPKEVITGLIVSIVSGALIWGYIELEDIVTTEPLTANINPADGQTSIRPFFELQIKPALSDFCSKAAWAKWIGKTLYGEECYRLEFQPHTLIDMETRREFKESAEPAELMRLFIQRHDDCLTLRSEGDTYQISEIEDSSVLREGGRPICP